MSFTMPLAANITYSLNVSDTAFLSLIQFLAIASHPTAPRLIYALYGNTFNSSQFSYNSYQLLTWRALDTSSTHTLVDNMTFAGNLHCFPAC